MYDIAKKARAGMKAKAERLAGEKDRKTDSSNWSPAEPLNADVKTGMRPVSRKAYKKGGAVKGEVGKQRADRTPRKAGGKTEAKGEQPLVDRYVNRDLKKANEYRDGKKHVGGMKHGGRAKYATDGAVSPKYGSMEEMIKKNPAPEKKPLGLDKIPLPPRRPENLTPAVSNPKFKSKYDLTTHGKKNGGAAKHSDVKEDKALIKKMIKESEAKEKCYGGRTKKADGGMMMDPRLGIVKNKAFEFGQNTVVPGLKKGGRAEKASGGSAEFKAAFRAARNAFLAGEGPKNFEFKGKSYSTDLAKTPTTTGPSTRGRGTTASPERRIQKNITVEFGPPKTGMPDVDVMGNPTGGGMKKGGRIKKQIGGALGRAAGALTRGMPNVSAPAMGQMGVLGSPNQGNFGGRGPAPQAFDRAQGRPFQGGQFMPPGRGGEMTQPGFGGGKYRPIDGGMAYLGGSKNFDESTGMYRNPPALGIPSGQTAGGQLIGQPQMPIRSDFTPIGNAGLDGVKGPMMGDMPMQQFVGQPALYSPMARKNGGRVARAYGGEINEQSEGKHKSKGKGKDTHVNIVIAMGKGDQQDMGQQMPMNPPPPPPPMALNTPPAPMGGAPMPPPAMGGGMPPMPPDGMMPPMPRKAGGRVSKVAKSYKDMTAGAGSGEGRLQKTDIAKRTAHKSGGKVYRSYRDMDAGAGSGEGRLEKTEIQKRKK